ncbi:MAG TPA: DUF3093 domain-containing protein [Micromonosporaceae bacterium]|nr:DUF3093 domain-containing protein [Micromonosporaceae bacterium]
MPDNIPVVRYAERLVLPWWLWTCGFAVAGLLAAEIHLGAPGLRSWVPYTILLPLTGLGLWWLGQIRIAVAGDVLEVDDARLAVGYIAAVEPLTTEQKRQLLGPGAHPFAFVVQRPWIRGAAKVTLSDPDDPTPYWVISCRRPARLAAAVETAAGSRPYRGDQGSSREADSEITAP